MAFLLWIIRSRKIPPTRVSSKLCVSSFQVQSSCQPKLTRHPAWQTWALYRSLPIRFDTRSPWIWKPVRVGCREQTFGIEAASLNRIAAPSGKGMLFAHCSHSKAVNGKCFFNRWIKNSGNVSEFRSWKSVVTVLVKTHKITIAPHSVLLRHDLRCCQSCCKYLNGKY